jgi:hypothetical protein
MKESRTKLLALLPALIPLLTCSLPPYNEGLSLGIETARKMAELGALEVTVGPVWVWDFDFRNREYYFMPNKAIGGLPLGPNEFKNGFIVSVDERSFDLSFVEYMGGPPDNYFFYRGWGEGIDNDDPDTNNYFAETVKGAAPFLLNFMRYEPKDYRNNQLRVIQYPPNPDWEVHTDFIDPSPPNPPLPDPPYLPNLRDNTYYYTFYSDPAKWPTIVGSSITPVDAGDDLQVCFCKFEENGNFAEVFYLTLPDRGIDATAPQLRRDDLDFNFPDDVDNGFYQHIDLLDLSFFSYYSKTQHKYKNYRWDAAGLLEPLVDMDRRIDAALTNGDLLSFEDNRCYVYNGHGKKQYYFLMGGLHFCYEIYLGGVPHTVFTLPAMLTSRDHDDELYFYVYVLPTDRLRELE